MKKIGLVIGMLLVVFACKKGEKVMYKTSLEYRGEEFSEEELTIVRI